MPELSKDAVALFAYLLPGFLAAWVLYGFTSDPKPSQFERVVQALIFTFLVNAFLPVLEGALIAIGSVVGAARPWDAVSENLARVVLAFLLGGTLAVYTNTDSIHKWLRGLGLTTRTSYPSEWFGVLSKTVAYVVLHMHDGRRLYGWPKEWPNDPDRGHFFVMQASWINADGSALELTDVHGLLINVKDVKWVEFVGDPKEQPSA